MFTLLLACATEDSGTPKDTSPAELPLECPPYSGVSEMGSTWVFDNRDGQPEGTRTRSVTQVDGNLFTVMVIDAMEKFTITTIEHRRCDDDGLWLLDVSREVLINADSSTTTTTSVYDPPAKELIPGLAVDVQWTTYYQGTTTGEDTEEPFDFQTDHWILRADPLTTPAGSFTALYDQATSDGPGGVTSAWLDVTFGVVQDDDWSLTSYTP